MVEEGTPGAVAPSENLDAQGVPHVGTPEADALENAKMEAAKGDTEIPLSLKRDENGLILGKFKTEEEFVKAYNNLEVKQSGGDVEEKPEEKETPKEEEASDEDVADAIGAEDFNKYSTEYDADGKLSEESYKELAEKHQLPKEIVDEFIGNRVANNQKQEAELKGLAGGEESYDKLVDWADKNLTQAEKDAYNNTVLNAGTTKEQKASAIRDLNTRFNDTVNGGTTEGLGGPAGGQSFGDVFNNDSEVIKAMQNNEYNTNTDFRKNVQDKVARSMKAGTISPA